MKEARFIILVSIGTISVGLGILGILVPVLPTTPFLLLGAACYANSSQNMYQRLITNKHLGPYVVNYREKRAIPLKGKIMAVAMIWITIPLCVIYAIPLFWVKLLLLAIASMVTWHLLSLVTLNEND